MERAIDTDMDIRVDVDIDMDICISIDADVDIDINANMEMHIDIYPWFSPELNSQYLDLNVTCELTSNCLQVYLYRWFVGDCT